MYFLHAIDLSRLKDLFRQLKSLEPIQSDSSSSNHLTCFRY